MHCAFYKGAQFLVQFSYSWLSKGKSDQSNKISYLILAQNTCLYIKRKIKDQTNFQQRGFVAVPVSSSSLHWYFWNKQIQEMTANFFVTPMTPLSLLVNIFPHTT